MGGNAPFIVMDDADLDKTVKALLASKFRNAGQTCICTNRIYVHENIADRFVEQFKDELSKLKVGNGLQEGMDIGPLIDQKAVDKVNEILEDAVNKGGKIAYRGVKPDSAEGFFFDPIILTNIQDDMLCVEEEIFGPLAPISTFRTEEEVIERANNTVYGLAAYVFTENLSRAFRMSEGLEYGIIGLNDGLPSTAQAPFGGFKESGLGREGGHHGIEEYLETKYISIGLSDK